MEIINNYNLNEDECAKAVELVIDSRLECHVCGRLFNQSSHVKH